MNYNFIIQAPLSKFDCLESTLNNIKICYMECQLIDVHSISMPFFIPSYKFQITQAKEYFGYFAVRSLQLSAKRQILP